MERHAAVEKESLGTEESIFEGSRLQRALRQLRRGGMASVLETRVLQVQAEPMAPIDLISCLVSDELARRSDRLN